MDRKLDELHTEEAITMSPDFWDRPKDAEKVLASIKNKKQWTDAYQKLEGVVADLEVMFEFYQSGDATAEETDEQYAQTLKIAEDLEFKNVNQRFQVRYLPDLPFLPPLVLAAA